MNWESKISCDLLSRDTLIIVVIGNQIRDASEICLYYASPGSLSLNLYIGNKLTSILFKITTF